MHKLKYNNQQSGFTIIELLITISLAAVLTSLAAPAFKDMIKKNQLAAQANSVMASMNYARNETITRNADVILQPVTGTDWAVGWQASSGGTVIRNFDPIEGATLVGSAASITYESDGSLSGTATITLTLTPTVCTTGKEYIRTITVVPSGHSRVSSSTCP